MGGPPGRVSLDGVPDFILHDSQRREASLDSNYSDTFPCPKPRYASDLMSNSTREQSACTDFVAIPAQWNSALGWINQGTSSSPHSEDLLFISILICLVCNLKDIIKDHPQLVLLLLCLQNLTPFGFQLWTLAHH